MPLLQREVRARLFVGVPESLEKPSNHGVSLFPEMHNIHTCILCDFGSVVLPAASLNMTSHDFSQLLSPFLY